MALKKSENEIEKMRQGGAILSRALKAAVNEVQPGVALRQLDQVAEKTLLENGAEPSFKGYQTSTESTPFPSTVCISVNEELVHARGDRDIDLKEGDIVSLDIGCWYQGLCTDMAVTVPVGKVSDEAMRLIKATRMALDQAIAAVLVGGVIADIGKAVEDFVAPFGFGVVRSLVGHGVGHSVHEPPSIPNFYEPRSATKKIKEGMCLALEPMVGLGGYQIETADDGWAVLMADRKLSAHFEVTVVALKDGAEILTPLPI